MKLKVMAISDLHGFLPEITESADIAIIAGDTIPLQYQFNKPNSKLWLENEFAEWIIKLPVNRVFMIAGNHDAYFESLSQSNILAFNQACRKLTYLKNEISHYYDNDGQLWSIFGTPYCHTFGNWPFMRSDDYMTENFKEIPDKIDIIISHDPPFACGDVDVILESPAHRAERMFKHLGNKPLRERIENVDYKLLVCGHIHSGDHNFNEDWKVVNVSYLNESYEPHYPPFYIELEHDIK
jgi:Icc-related predicted phosphoesterase